MIDLTENRTNKKIAKSVINANLFNGSIMLMTIFAQLAMMKVIIETQSEYAITTYILSVLIVVFSIFNFKLQNEKYFLILNSITAFLFCINLYIFLFQIIGF